MNFREMALDAHHKEEQQDAAWRSDRADDFAERARRAFKRSIHDAIFTVSVISPSQALLVIDGIEIEAREEYDAVEFYFAATCPLCGEKSYVSTPTLADIGKAIENGPTNCRHCDASRSASVMPGGWADQIADAIRQAVEEALSE